MRGRKAAVEHICNKQNPEKTGKWIVKDGQAINFTRPIDRSSWDDIMSQRILVECNVCGTVKHCLLEKLNIAHFEGTKYVVPEDFWTKSVNVLSTTATEAKVESPEKKKERKERIEKTAEILTSKAARLKNKINVTTKEE
jgi:hypothetical protein